MRLSMAVVAVLVLCGCAAQNEISKKQREAESNAPDLSFQGPLRPVTLSAAQIKLVQQSVAANLKDPSAKFGSSYRGAVSANGETIVCGYVNGRKFAGMFAKPVDGPTEFLPIGISIDQQEEDAVKSYCRSDGIYLPR